MYYYSSSSSSKKMDMKMLRSMLQKRIQRRANDFPIRALIPVAEEVLRSRKILFHGVSTLLKFFPVLACKFCPEVYIDEEGHLIQTCHGYRRRSKNKVHQWIVGGLNDILVPVEAFHLQDMFQDVIKHHERFDLERVSAVVELCWQAGAAPSDEDLYPTTTIATITTNLDGNSVASDRIESLSPQELQSVAKTTLDAWETLRSGVQRLLLAYPAKVCKYCSEVHVGPSGHLARNCGMFKFESWRGTHFWEKAKVDDLVPQKIVWRRRPHDPPVLLDKGRDFYGHAPAVVDLCTKAGIVAPVKYNCMMKIQGLSTPAKLNF